MIIPPSTSYMMPWWFYHDACITYIFAHILHIYMLLYEQIYVYICIFYSTKELMCVSFVNKTQIRDTTQGRGNLSWGIAPIKLASGHFLDIEGPVHYRQCHRWAGGSGLCKKGSWTSAWRQGVKLVPLWSLLQPLPSDSCSCSGFPG